MNSRILCALVVLLTGFASASWAAPGAQHGGTLVYALTSVPDRLDPNLTGIAQSQVVFFQIFDTLIVRDQKSKQFRPWLATEWSVSPDGRAFTLHLRPGVTFQDGTPFDAAAVKFNFDRTHNPKLATRCGNCAVGFYDHSEVLDARTVRIVLNRPWAPFLDALGLHYRMVSPAGVKKYGDEDFGQHPVGSGPFRFVEWVPNDHITLERYDAYNWAPSIMKHRGSAYLDRVTFRILPEAATRVAALENGELQVIDDVPAQDFARLVKDPRYTPFIGNVPGVPFSWAMNVTKSPTSDLAVRRALEYGIDRPTIAKTIFGPYQALGAYLPAYGELTQYTWGYDKGSEIYHYDPEKAMRLLDEAGWKVGRDGIREKDGQRLTIALGAPDHGAPEVMQSELRRIGVDLQIIVATWLVINGDQRKGVTLLAPLPGARSDPDVMSHQLHSREIGSFNFSFVHDPELDALLDAQVTQLNPTVRLKTLSKAQRRVMDQAYMLPVYDYDEVALKAATVRDLAFDSVGRFPWIYDAWLSAK
jgi:peptide/nickel transport system substrate-binding protein